MKSRYKFLASAALSGLFSLLVAFSAGAQHRGGGGGGSHGGGGGFHGGGGFSGGHSGGFSGGRSGGGYSGGHFQSPGAGSYSRGGGSFSRPQGSYSRPQGGFSRPQGSYSSPRVNSVPSIRGRADIGGRGGYSVGGRYAAPSRSYSYGRGGGVYSRGYAGPRVGYRGGFYGSYNHGRFYSYNRFYGHYAFYNRYYAPRIGFHLSVLPYGYYPFYWGDYQYFYSDGYYYQYNDNNYTVVEPPLGAIMNQLPAGAKSLMIDGEQYYELNGVYYQAITKDDGTTGYQIAGKDGQLTTAAGDAPQDDVYNQGAPAPQDQNPAAQSQSQDYIRIGDVFDSLPPNCSTVKIDGQKYFVSPDGVYYQEDRDGNRKVYRVAGTPDDQPGN